MKNIISNSVLYVGGNLHNGDIIIYNINGVNRSIPLVLNTLPHIPKSAVIGRDKDLQKVYDLFQTSNKVVLVNGIGGIGKTTLAKYFVTHFQAKFNHVAWITVSSGIKEAFVSNVELLDSLYLREELAQLPKNEQWVDTVFSLIVNRMRQLKGETKEQKNLLIIDNVGEDIEDIKILDQIALRPNWKVLVTSREKLLGFEEYELGFLSLEDAKTLFYLHYQREQDDDLVEEILGLIQKHTLTIELLAKSINNNPRLNLKQLKDLLHERGVSIKKEVDIKLNYDKVKGYTTISDCLKLAFDISDLNKDVLLILCQLSVLPSELISLETLIEIFQIDESKEIALINNLNKLVSKGWLMSINSNYSMHGVISDVIRQKLAPNMQNCENLVNFFTNGIDREINNDPNKHFELTKYTNFIKGLLRFIPSSCLETAKLFNQLSELLRIKGKYNEALVYQLSSIKLKEEKFPDAIIELAVSYNNIGILYRKLNEHELAYGYLYKAINIYESISEINNRLMANAYNNISVVLKYLGKFELALEYQFKSIEKGKTDGYRLDYSYNNISIIYRNMKLYEKALEYRIKCHQIFERQSPLSSNLPASYNSWGIILSNLKRYEEAIEKFDLAISLHKKIFKEDNPDSAVYYQQLGGTYIEVNHLEEAIKWLEKAKSIQENNKYQEHRDYANTLNYISIFYQKKGQIQKAKDYLKKVILIHENEKDNSIIKSYLEAAIHRLSFLESLS